MTVPPLFQRMQLSADMVPLLFPHSVAVSKASESTDPDTGRIVTDLPPGAYAPCLISTADPEEVATLWAQQRIQISHVLYFPADPGCAENDILIPQDNPTTMFRVKTIDQEMRAGILWTIRALEQAAV